MKLLVYEHGSGFSSYIYKVCNALCEQMGSEADISYMTIKNNDELADMYQEVKVLPMLLDYDLSKKNSIKWMINRFYVSLYCVIKRNNHCKDVKYDAISVQSTIPIVDQFFLPRLCKINPNVVYTVHDVIPPSKSLFWTRKSLKRIYDTVPSLIVHTQGNKKQLMDEFNIPEEKISVVHHGTDIEYEKLDKEKCKERFGLDKNKITLLFYGSIREQKGLDDLLNAMKGINNIQLLIAGSMPYGESFEKYSKLIEENALDVISHIKYIPSDWTDALFQASDVVCLPYKYFFSQSGVFMQAIKYRRPVIVSDVSSFREYINNYNMGVLCEPNNASDLHNKILQFIESITEKPEHYYVGLEKAARENSWNESANKYIDCFNYFLERKYNE